jgi:hypothetical protein
MKKQENSKYLKAAIVTTTINIPIFLEGYIHNFTQYSVDYERIVFIIVGDLKSSSQDIRKYIEKLDPRFAVEYLDISSQEKWLLETYGAKAFEKAKLAIPYNSIRRRNVGYLRALELGTEAIITVDDDNYAGFSNWLHEHLTILNSTEPLPTVSSVNQIVNPCRVLKFNYSDAKVFSRGYPFSRLFSDTFDVKIEGGGKVALNMGLWTESPDVDAYTNILYPDLKSLGFKEDVYERYALSLDNYMPVNTQNTAFIRELTPAFYDLLMDTHMFGTRIDRYDDIWAGLFALKLIHRLNYRATFGIPLTVHRRNRHDYILDLKSELIGMSLNDLIYKIVMNADIQSKDFIDGYLELAQILENDIKRLVTDPNIIEYFSKLVKAMNIWIELVEVFI